MRFQIIPKEQGFYDLFTEAANHLVTGSALLAEMLAVGALHEDVARRMREAEHAADETTHAIVRRVNSVFVTPFDREDIYALASGIDDILDLIEAVSDLLVLHNIAQPLDEMRMQADVLLRACEQVYEATLSLRRFAGLERYWVEINRLENEGDRIYRQTVAHLFSGDFRAMDVLKWKDLVDQLEAAIDKCEDVSNTMESIVLKHA